MFRPYCFNRQWAGERLLPVLVVVSPVVVDLVNGYLVMTGRVGLLSVGVVFRGTITLVGIYCLFKCRIPSLKFFILALVGSFLVENLVWVSFSGLYSPGYEINRFFKILFPWLVVAILFYAERSRKLEPKFLLYIMTWVGVLTAVSLVFSLLSGFGFETYGDYSYGIKGFFDAQNDTGLTLLLSLVAAITIFLDQPGMMRLIYIGTIILGCFLLGTRAGFIGPLLIILCFIFAGILNRRMLFSRSRGVAFTFFSVALVFMLLAGGLYFIFSNFQKIDYTLTKIEKLTQQTPRSRLEAAGGERIGNRGALFTVFGEGGASFRINVGSILNIKQSSDERTPGRVVENDLYDVFGNYGLLLFSIVYSWLGVLFLGALLRAVTRFCRLNLALLLVMGLYLGHSSVAGHALISAQVGNIIAPCFFLLVRNNKFFGSRITVANEGVSKICFSAPDILNGQV